MVNAILKIESSCSSPLPDFLQGLDFGVEVVLLLGSWAIEAQIESILDLSFLFCR